MRAFIVAARAAASYYNDLFLLMGLGLVWWLTGGIFLVAAGALTIPLFLSGLAGPWWLAPLIGIPAGPALAAMAAAARRSARDIHVDRGHYMAGLRSYWRPAIRLSAIGAVVLVLLLLNVTFYYAQPNRYLQLFSIFWVYLIIAWFAIQLYVYPILVAMEKPRALIALRTAAMAAFANPLFSFMLVLVAGLITAICTVLVAPLFIAWPALIVLSGEHALRLFLQRAGVNPDKGEG